MKWDSSGPHVAPDLSLGQLWAGETLVCFLSWHRGGYGTGSPESRAPTTGAVVLDVTCFSEAERLYVLLKDMAVRGRLLTALVLPDLLVSERWSRLFTHPGGGEREVRVFRCTGPTARLALFLWHLFIEFTGGS